MQRIVAGSALVLCTLALACGPAEEAEPEDEMEGLTVADLAGTWNLQAIDEAGDTVPRYETAQADSVLRGRIEGSRSP